MGDQIQAIGATGLSPQMLIWDSTSLVFQHTTNTFVAYVTANRANYEIALTEKGTASGHYAGTFDSDIAVGDYGVAVWDAAGEGANLLAAGQISWDATDLIEAATIGLTVQAKTDVSAATWDELRSKHTVVGSFGEGGKLSPDGLDKITITQPAGVAGNFREMVVQTWRRKFKKAIMTVGATGEIKTFDDAGSGVLTTQIISDDGATQTQGAAT